MSAEGDDSALATRLDAVLRLILDYQRDAKGTTVGDQILVLMDTGLSQTEAGRILGVESNQIPSYLRRAKNQTLYEKLKGKPNRSKSQ
jgi:hypothetical protein